ncbi:hypothetical protein Pelo_10989 [Pelomyxa schiedti]|nr:hypothetical protein Pelo_10989 [Pelomyxa schiedti]
METYDTVCHPHLKKKNKHVSGAKSKVPEEQFQKGFSFSLWKIQQAVLCSPLSIIPVNLCIIIMYCYIVVWAETSKQFAGVMASVGLGLVTAGCLKGAPTPTDPLERVTLGLE